YRPSVVGDVTPDMEIVREEIFGPVAALVRFDTEHDAIRLANDTSFGLAAYLFSQNLSRAWRVAEKLDAGMVGVNEGIFSNAGGPFGGVKDSGLGREGGAEMNPVAAVRGLPKAWRSISRSNTSAWGPSMHDRSSGGGDCGSNELGR